MVEAHPVHTILFSFMVLYNSAGVVVVNLSCALFPFWGVTKAIRAGYAVTLLPMCAHQFAATVNEGP